MGDTVASGQDLPMDAQFTSKNGNKFGWRGWRGLLPTLLFGCWPLYGCGVVQDTPDVADASLADGSPADALPDAMPDAMPDAAPPPGPNCSGLTETCGPGGNEDCCASEIVPGGTYYRSYDVATDSHNDMSYPATVSDFRLDRYQITVGRFRAFVEAGKGTQAQPPAGGSGAHAAIAGSGWEAGQNSSLPADTAALMAAVKCSAGQTWTDAPGANEHRPMNCITWYEAMAFCIWDGGYLPTEAEWNYAAAGGNQQRAYPWSSPANSTTIDATYAVYDGTGSTADVGSKSPKGDGRWGHADLAGNVHEWTLDWAAMYTNPCANCANLTAASNRVFRGGSFNNVAASQRVAIRPTAIPSSRVNGIGARCARTP